MGRHGLKGDVPPRREHMFAPKYVSQNEDTGTEGLEVDGH